MLGLFNTIRLTIWSTLLAVVLGTVVGLFRLSPSLFKRMLGRTYVEGIRNLPPLVLVFIFYFFLSDQIMPLLGLDQAVREMSPSARSWVAFFWAPAGGVSSFLSAVFTLAIYEGAFIAEIVRSGIESVPKGQWEAGHALGLSWPDQMRFVVMPQAMRQHPAAPGRAVHLRHQGFGHSQRDFGAGAHLSGHGAHERHLQDVRGMDNHRLHVSFHHPVLFPGRGPSGSPPGKARTLGVVFN